jgi:L-seryl-tRNA(Ser) seleniumtransferase
VSTLSALPSIDRILAHPRVRAQPGLPRVVVRDAARLVLDGWRGRLRAGEQEAPGMDPLVDEVLRSATEARQSAWRRVVNATGVVLHTNLGRAPLAAPVAARVAELAPHWLNLEMDLEEGQRDHRHDRLRPALLRILGCGEAVVVNNNAAATLLTLAAIAGDRAVAVSRGEQIEIGGSFRMPDIVAQSGARMLEVGTTNRTWLRDYERAIDDGAAVVLKIHRSNFRVEGFTHEATVEELGELCRRRGVPLVHDLGMGLPHEVPGLGEEHVAASLRAGASLVLFSGDKLLGGPQCGVIVGEKELVARVRSHPLCRVLRPDKMVLVALEETLLLWEADRSGASLPAVWMMRRSGPELEAAARRLAARAAEILAGRVEVGVEDCDGAAGGGSLPGLPLPSWAVTLQIPGGGTTQLAERLRRGAPPVVGQMDGGRLLLHTRTLLPGDDALLLDALRSLSESP